MQLKLAAAISAHRSWVLNLEAAIADKVIPTSMKRAGYDDMCEFGKWLYSLDDAVKISKPYRRAKDLHYRFHQEAARVVELALEGDLDAAALLARGDFRKTSQELIAAMEGWQAELPA